MKKRFDPREKTYDERETLIRNRVYKHGLFVLAALVLADMLFREQGTPWAQGIYNHLVYLAAVAAFVFIEFAVRGVYYGRRDRPVIALITVLLWAGVGGFRIHNNISIMGYLGASIMENGMLSLRGAYVITDCVLIFACLCVAVRAVVDICRDRKAKES